MRLVLTVLILGSVGGCVKTPPPAVAVPATLPSTSVLTLDGQSTLLSQAAAGRVALVSLWATWCEPCLAEMPALLRFAERAPEAGAAGFAVAIGESREHVSAFVRDHGFRNATLSHLVDEHYQFAESVGQRRVPATLVVNRHGRIVFTGAALDEAALEAVRRSLSEP